MPQREFLKMPRIIVLFNLKSDVDVTKYEAWAVGVDAPTVNGLPSVSKFSVHRSVGLLGTDTAAPYEYVEVLDVNNLDGLFADISCEAMQAVAAQFQEFADNPQFILTEDVV
jgi:hypothetical protein